MYPIILIWCILSVPSIKRIKNHYTRQFLVITVSNFFWLIVTDFLGMNVLLHPYVLESPPRDIQNNHIILIVLIYMFFHFVETYTNVIFFQIRFKQIIIDPSNRKSKKIERFLPFALWLLWKFYFKTFRHYHTKIVGPSAPLKNPMVESTSRK